MKKTFITLLAFAGVVVGAEQSISLTGLTNNSFSSSTANCFLTWDTTQAEATLNSWKLAFTMTPTVNEGEWVFKVPAVGDDNPGITIQKYDGKLWIKASNEANGTGIYLEGYAMPTSTTVAVTLSYVANENLDGELTGDGLFTLSATYTKSGETAETTLSCIREFKGEYTTALTQGTAQLNVHGGKTSFANISLTHLDNKIIPEPATTTLSLLALCGLTARRRRR